MLPEPGLLVDDDREAASFATSGAAARRRRRGGVGAALSRASRRKKANSARRGMELTQANFRNRSIYRLRVAVLRERRFPGSGLVASPNGPWTTARTIAPAAEQKPMPREVPKSMGGVTAVTRLQLLDARRRSACWLQGSHMHSIGRAAAAAPALAGYGAARRRTGLRRLARAQHKASFDANNVVEDALHATGESFSVLCVREGNSRTPRAWKGRSPSGSARMGAMPPLARLAGERKNHPPR